MGPLRVAHQSAPNRWIQPRRGRRLLVVSVREDCLLVGRGLDRRAWHSSARLLPGGAPHLILQAAERVVDRVEVHMQLTFLQAVEMLMSGGPVLPKRLLKFAEGVHRGDPVLVLNGADGKPERGRSWV